MMPDDEMESPSNAELAARSDKEGGPAARFLTALAEAESAASRGRRIARRLADGRLPAGKTLADFEPVPRISKA
jgi:hypothetical protein